MFSAFSRNDALQSFSLYINNSQGEYNFNKWKLYTAKKMTEDGEYSFPTNNPMSGINLRVAIDQVFNSSI